MTVITVSLSDVSHLWPWPLWCAECGWSYWWRCTHIHQHLQMWPLGSESTYRSSLSSFVALLWGLDRPWSRWYEELALMVTNKALHRVTHIKWRSDRTSFFQVLLEIRCQHSHSCSDALQEKLLSQQDQFGAGQSRWRQPGGGSLDHWSSWEKDTHNPPIRAQFVSSSISVSIYTYLNKWQIRHRHPP